MIMMDETDKKLYDYLIEHAGPEDDVLQQLNRETHVKILHPRMLAGHLQGVILKMFSKMIQPKYILEIGTYTGYSAICLAQGLNKNGVIHTIEINDELYEMAKKYFIQAGCLDRIKQYTGDAREIIKSLHYTYDLVYVDGDKKEYAEYYLLAVEKLRKGGMIIVDNVLWNGKVINNKRDKETQGIRKFNELVKNDSRVEKVILPVRDGIMLIRKKE